MNSRLRLSAKPQAAAVILLADAGASVRAFALLLAIMLLLAVGLGVAVILKRKLFKDDDPASGAFSLAELKQMHEAGQLSSVEYESAKQSVLEQLKKEAKTGKNRSRR